MVSDGPATLNDALKLPVEDILFEIVTCPATTAVTVVLAGIVTPEVIVVITIPGMIFSVVTPVPSVIIFVLLLNVPVKLLP